ncbi:hypothetical protein SCHPADRAFT_905974 [Schizopora paradoxa]|uniref:RlpA-like protein double-psi beta-barrel domain-containing protein n=1 Tax=Schizopora paradoxa TaxID=27342 RepID=A0A0H2RPU4_9AGAM|nr:hypothetical protein SCHPADRAFT_905974 [Schizopora paradoxa]
MKLKTFFSNLASIAISAPLVLSSAFPLDARFPTAGLSEVGALHIRQTNNTPITSSVSVFNPGLGACGQASGENDFVIALSTSLFDNGAHCLQWVNIEARGKTAFAQVVDVCPTCSSDNIEMSPPLFDVFNFPSVGQQQVQWFFEPA